MMMDRIHPLVVRNLPILPARKQEEKEEEEEEEFVSMVSELGVYGYLLRCSWSYVFSSFFSIYFFLFFSTH